jgi:hypothetical protein
MSTPTEPTPAEVAQAKALADAKAAEEFAIKQILDLTGNQP